jgi:2-methylcitrate dehydratase PrpD
VTTARPATRFADMISGTDTVRRHRSTRASEANQFPVSSLLARFIVSTRFEDLPSQAVHMGKRCLLDALGVSLAASGLGEGCQAFFELAAEQMGQPLCTILGYGEKVPVEAAAFANGALAHAIDYGDEHDGLLLHPNAQAVPAALAIAEACGPISGRELITAIVLACEVVCRLALASRVSLSDYGWYPPPIFAAFGATAAAARLLRLPESQVVDAMSLTLCQTTCSGEIKYDAHSIIRGVRDAFGARAGVSSALLARKGVTGFKMPFEGRSGFFKMYARGSYDPQVLIRGLGETYEIENVSFKPWPACRGTHAAIDATLELRRTHNIGPADVRAVRVCGASMMRMLSEPIDSKRQPATAIDAKFSIPFTVGTALAKGRVTLEDFLPATRQDPTVLRLARLVRFEVDAQLSFSALSSKVEILMRNGATCERFVELPRGSPVSPISDVALTAKFNDCLQWAAHPISSATAKRISETVFSLDKIDDVRTQLMSLMAHES